MAEALGAIPDRRRAHLRVHGLVPRLQFSVAAMLCGARSLYAMAQWGRERGSDRPELLLALGLAPGRSPSVSASRAQGARPAFRSMRQPTSSEST